MHRGRVAGVDFEDEFAALTSGTAFADRSDAGRLGIEGADALDLLNRLTTNKLEELPEGEARATVVTNGDGRVVDFVALAAVSGGLLALTSPGRAATVIDWLDTYTFGEEITVIDRTADTGQLSLAGPAAAQSLERAGAPVGGLALDRVCEAKLGGASVVVWHSLPGGADGYEIVVDAADAEAVRAALAAAGAMPVSAEAWEAYRIANGMPAFGSEFGEFNNPLEPRLLGAISDDKGCYTGQEVIARLQTYRKVQRRLMSVALSGPAEAGAQLMSGDAKAGTLTSVVRGPAGYVALALVAAKQATAGSVLSIDDSDTSATLHDPSYALSTEPADPQ